MITTKLHTIFITIGPTSCGKTYFCQKKLRPALMNELEKVQLNQNIQYISSDVNRRLLLYNDTLKKYDMQMLEVSSQAFVLLKTQIKLVTSFPVNAYFVIVDTTGLAKEFREEIEVIANQNNYNIEYIVFDYKNRNNYFKYEKNNYKIINNHIKKLRTNVLKNIKRSKSHFITNPENDFKVNIENISLYKKYHLKTTKKYLIIGDVHTCINELKQLIIKFGFIIEDEMIKYTENVNGVDIILIGDIVDKGEYSCEIINFVHKNLNNFKIVLGNHENTVYNLLKNIIKESEYNTEFIKKYYNSYLLLKNNSELKQKFYDIIDNAVPFYVYKSVDNKSKSFYITHAPCHNKFIGKIDDISIKNQVYFKVEHNNLLIESIAQFINKDSYNYPLHVVGHICLQEVYNGLKEGNNMLFIDTGCIEGNKLTAILLGKNINNPYFFEVNSTLTIKTPLQKISKYRSKIKLDELDIYKQKRIKNIIKNKINYISGTMSPADKDIDELESLKQGLLYYYNKFNEYKIKMNLCIQPKYMGSRVNIYLYNNIEQSFAVSRNGYLIKIDTSIMMKVYKKLHNKLKNFMSTNNVKMMIIDGELMPWKALADGLIETKFKPIDIALQTEIALLKEYDFDEQYKKLIERMKMSEYEQDVNKLTKKQLLDKYGQTDYENYKLLYKDMDYISVNQVEEYAKKYHEQIENYGADAEIICKPFSILKLVFNNGNDCVLGLNSNNIIKLGQIDLFKLVSDDPFYIVDFNKSFEKILKESTIFFNKITIDKKMEGVVIKPDMYVESIAPFLKVRNEDYLTIVYGYDYKTNYKYNKLMNQKNIRKKLEMSIKEYKIGLEMLKTKMEDITFENNNYIQFLNEFLFAEELGRKLDPRL